MTPCRRLSRRRRTARGGTSLNVRDGSGPVLSSLQTLGRVAHNPGFVEGVRLSMCSRRAVPVRRPPGNTRPGARRCRCRRGHDTTWSCQCAGLHIRHTTVSGGTHVKHVVRGSPHACEIGRCVTRRRTGVGDCEAVMRGDPSFPEGLCHFVALPPGGRVTPAERRTRSAAGHGRRPASRPPSRRS
jgi:hypothetical protein